MKNLIAFVEQHNAMCRTFGAAVGQPMDARNLSNDEIVALGNKLESALSPENLSEDGELRGIALRRKSKMLHAARQELIQLSMARAIPVSQLLLAA